MLEDLRRLRTPARRLIWMHARHREQRVRSIDAGLHADVLHPQRGDMWQRHVQLSQGSRCSRRSPFEATRQ